MYITFEEDKPMVEEEVKPTGDSAETEIAATGFTPGPADRKRERRPQGHSMRGDHLRPRDGGA